MRLSPDEQDTCDGCGWANALVRRRCRNCGAVLAQHPDRAIDREVRQDAEDGRRYERAVAAVIGEVDRG